MLNISLYFRGFHVVCVDAACLQCLLQRLVNCLKGKKSSVGAKGIRFYKVVIIFNVLLWWVRTQQKKGHALLFLCINSPDL